MEVEEVPGEVDEALQCDGEVMRRSGGEGEAEPSGFSGVEGGARTQGDSGFLDEEVGEDGLSFPELVQGGTVMINDFEEEGGEVDEDATPGIGLFIVETEGVEFGTDDN